jgi:hypothetical protein
VFSFLIGADMPADVGIASPSIPTLDDLVTALKTQTPTNNWDVVASYSADALNSVLAASHSDGKLVTELPVFCVQSVDLTTGNPLVLYFDVTLGAPTISFTMDGSDLCVFTMPIETAYCYVVAGDTCGDQIPATYMNKLTLPAGYSLIASVGVAAMHGDGSITTTGGVVTFGPSTDQAHIVLHFMAGSNAPGYHISPPPLATWSLMTTPIETYFQTDVNEIDYALTVVRADPQASAAPLADDQIAVPDVSLAARSFIFDMQGGVLSLYIQTANSGAPQGDVTIAPFKVSGAAMPLVPADHTMSLIFSRALIETCYLSPVLAAQGSVSFASGSSGITAGLALTRAALNYDASYDVDYSASVAVTPDFNIDFSACPYTVTFDDATASLSFSYQQTVKWTYSSEQNFGSWGHLTVSVALSASADIVTNSDGTISVDFERPASDYRISAEAGNEDVYGIGSSIGSDFENRMKQFPPPALSLNFGSLHTFAVGNLLFPSSQSFTIDATQTAGARVPRDLLLVGSLSVPPAATLSRRQARLHLGGITAMPINPIYFRYLAAPVTAIFGQATNVIWWNVRGVTPKPMTSGPAFQEFASSLLAGKSSASDARDLTAKLRQFAASNPDGYAGALHDTVLPLVETAWTAHSKFADFKSPEAVSAVYTQHFLSSADSGHCHINVSFDAHPNPSAHVNNSGVLNYYTQAFPGMCVGLSNDLYLQLVRSDRRAARLGPNDAMISLYPEIRTFNEGLAPSPAGTMYKIGDNSYVKAEAVGRSSVTDSDLFTALMATTAVHSQDGVVPWTTMTLPGVDGFVANISIHLGDSPVAGADVIADSFPTFLFKTLFRRATLYSELGYKGEIARQFPAKAVSLLDPDMRTWFEGQVKELDPRLSMDTGYSIALDSTAGRVMVELRIMTGGDTVATITNDDVTDQALSSPAAYDELIEQGENRSIRDNYQGIPMVDGTEPADRVSPVWPSINTAVVTEPDPETTPLLPPFDAADAVARLLPHDWDLIQASVVRTVEDEVTAALGEDLSTTSVPDLVAQVDTPAVRANIESGIGDTVLADAASTPQFTDLVTAAGSEELAEQLVGMNTTDPLVDAIFTAPPESQSLLRDLMEAKVAESVTHFCEQRADEIQTTIADSSQTISDTGTEIANKSDALKQVQDELKNNPGDTDLQNRAKKLSDEIAHAKQEQENAQNDLDNATTDKDLNEAAAKDAENAKTRANKDAQHRSDEVFPDGGDR